MRGAVLSITQQNFVIKNSDITDIRLMQTSFMVLAEYLLISMCDNTAGMNYKSMDFHLLWTSFPL